MGGGGIVDPPSDDGGGRIKPPGGGALISTVIGGGGRKIPGNGKDRLKLSVVQELISNNPMVLGDAAINSGPAEGIVVDNLVLTISVNF